MRKYLLLLLACAGLQADPLVEFKLGYFHYSDKHLRDVYGNGTLDAALSFTYPIWGNFNCYLAVESIHSHHHGTAKFDKIRLGMYPISLGAQYAYPISSAVDYYVTLGPQFIFYHQKTHRSTIANRMDKNGFGGFANTGFMFHFLPHFTFDIFAQYSYRVVHYQNIEIDQPFLDQFKGLRLQIGGVFIGAGLGYLF